MDRLTYIKEAIEDYKNGKMLVVVDDEDRENEGDFIISAELASPDDINFMIKYGRGLVCMPINQQTADRLNLYPMVANNTALHETSFTVSVDAINNATTGISSKDRWETVQVILNESSKPEDLGRPGHMFPIVAKDGGVLQRAGHTEAAVDLSKLAGLKPSALLVEIVDEDGTMARMDSLRQIATRHNLKLVAISDLIEYRRQTELLIDELTSISLPNKYGDFKLRLFEDKIHGDHHVALVKGDIDKNDDVLVRVHSQCLTGDIFGSLRCDCGSQLDTALSKIENYGKGVLVYLRQEGRGIGLKNKIEAYKLQDKGLDTVEANESLGFKPDLREYGIGAQILRKCGVRKMKLLTNNPRKIIGIEGYGLEVVGREPIEVEPNEKNKKYLITKRDKLGHLILDDDE
tara:strand:+ start:1561 stop:2772 length:1212 start_codon:yes stop_codon:yes gene_type:complete